MFNNPPTKLSGPSTLELSKMMQRETPTTRYHLQYTLHDLQQVLAWLGEKGDKKWIEL